MTELLEIDKKIVLKYLIDDNFTPENNGIKDFTKYQDSFKQRYNYSLENIKKILESNDIKEVNEEYISKVFKIIDACNDLLIKINPKNKETNDNLQTIQKKYEVKIAKNFEGLVTGIVLEPEKVDLQGQIVSEEEIYKAMKEYMLNYSNFDVMHNMEVLKSDKGEGRQVALIQNFIAPQDLNYGETVVKKGTWLQETLILDETLKKSVEDGKINGYSIYGKASITNI